MNKRILAALLLGAAVVSTTHARNQSGIDISNCTFSQEVSFDASIEWHGLFEEKTSKLSLDHTNDSILLIDSGEVDLSSFIHSSTPLSIGIDLLETMEEESPSNGGWFSKHNLLLAGTVATTAAAAALYMWYNPTQVAAATSTALVPYVGNVATTLLNNATQALPSAIQLIPAAGSSFIPALSAPITSASAMLPALATLVWKPELSAVPDLLTITPATAVVTPSAVSPSSALVTVAGQPVTSIEAANTFSFYTNLVAYAAKEDTTVADAFSAILSKNSGLAQFINLEVVTHLVAQNTPVETLPSVAGLLPSTAAVEAVAPAIDGSLPSFMLHPDVRVAPTAPSVVRAPKVALPRPSSFIFHPDYSVTMKAPKVETLDVAQSSPKLTPSLATIHPNSVDYIADAETPIALTTNVQAVATPDVPSTTLQAPQSETTFSAPKDSYWTSPKIAGIIGAVAYTAYKLIVNPQKKSSEELVATTQKKYENSSSMLFSEINYRVNAERAYEAILQARETHNVNPAEVLRILSHNDDPHFVESEDRNSKEFALSFYADATYFGNDFSDLQPYLMNFVDKDYLLNLLQAWVAENNNQPSGINLTAPSSTVVATTRQNGSSQVVSVNFAGRTILIDPLVVQRYMKRHNLAAQDVLRMMYPHTPKNLSRLEWKKPMQPKQQESRLSSSAEIEWSDWYESPGTGITALFEETPNVAPFSTNSDDEAELPTMSEEARIAFNTNAAFTTVLSAHQAEMVDPAEVLRLLKSPLNIISENALAAELAENFWRQDADGDIKIEELRQLLKGWVGTTRKQQKTSLFKKARQYFKQKLIRKN